MALDATRCYSTGVVLVPQLQLGLLNMQYSLDFPKVCVPLHISSKSVPQGPLRRELYGEAQQVCLDTQFCALSRAN